MKTRLFPPDFEVYDVPRLHLTNLMAASLGLSYSCPACGESGKGTLLYHASRIDDAPHAVVFVLES